MPVTAKLSKLFYDRLGDQVVDELVNLLNATDVGYRTELRDLNETNFARFDATVGQRFAEQDAMIARRFAEIEGKFEKRIVEVEAKFEKRIVEFEAKFEKRFAEQDAKLDKLDAKIDRVAAEIRESMERGLKDQTRWMFVVWASLLIPMISLWMRP